MISAFIVAVIAVFLSYLNGQKKENNFFLLAAFILLTTFLSLGYYWGNDVATYEERFERYSDSGIALFDFSQYGILAYKELGFVFINILCKPLGFWGMRTVLFVIENAIIYYLITKRVNKKWYWLAVFIYVFNPNFWVLSSSMMRQWLAICIVFLSIDFLLRGKYLKSGLLIFLASTIHLTAIVNLVFIPLFFLQRNSTKAHVFVFLLILFVYYLFSPFFISSLANFLISEEDYYMVYTSSHGGVGISGVGRLAIYILLLYSAIKYNYKDKLFNWIIMLYGFVLPLLSFGELSARLGLYFTVCTIIVYPSFMNLSNHNKLGKSVLVGVACSYLVYLFYLFFTGPTYSGAYYNYRILPFF